MPSRKPKELKSKSRPATGAQTTKPPEPRAPEPPAAKPTLKYASVVNAPVLRDPNGPERLFLIDAMGFIFRAFFAPMPMRMRSPGGLPTNVPFLFSNMVRKIIKDWKPDYLGVVFDVSAPTFRDKLFADYKAQRPPMPEDLSVQIPFVRQFCEAMRLPILEYSGYEADDVIGTMSRLATAKKLQTLIVTSDKDMLQLVNKDVLVLNPTKGDLLIDEKKVEDLMGVPPSKVADVMALMGDSIDNIPGARDPNDKPAPGERRKPGIGDVGAKQLIQQFGSAEETLKRAAEVKRASYREALEKCAKFVLLSKQLATIPTDAPVELNLKSLVLEEPDLAALRDLYVELGFSSLLRELTPLASMHTDDAETDYAPLDLPAGLESFLTAVPAGRDTAVWLGLDAQEADEEGFGSAVLSVEVSSKENLARIAANDLENKSLSEMAQFLADPKRSKIVHDPKLFHLLAAPDSIRDRKAIAGIKHATILYSYLLRPTTAKHSFAEVVLRHLNRTLSGASGERADFLQRVAPVLRAEVEKQGLLDVYEKIDLPLAPVLARMEAAGVRVDCKELDRISTHLADEMAKLEKTIFEMAGSEFNINSPQQLAEVLFDKLNLSPPRMGRFKPKSRSTAADVLEELSEVHDLPKKIIEYRELTKLKSNYADVLPRLIYPLTERLHTSFCQTGTATGRLSSSNPNLQNIPIRTELGREIRAAFVAPAGSLLLSADYSQIELRILAHLSHDPVLTEAFQRGEDIHSRTAQEVFGVGPMAQTREHRRVAKVINFGVIYGLSAFGLAQQLGIEQKEAAHFISVYFERYSGVKKFLDAQIAETRKTGFTRTLFGRTRPIPEISSPQANMRNFAERTAMNTPMQGAAADLIKLAMIELDRRLPAEKFQAKMTLQVHDELLFEAPESEIPRLRALVKDVMENVHKFRVPIVAETKVGPNWRDMK
ncbi:MAG: DNA polymerase I [Candidatus Acidiferrales bacterium]